MAFTKSLVIGFGDISKRLSISASGRNDRDETFVANTTDAPLEFALDVSQCKGLCLLSDVALTVETNASDHSGGNIFTLAAGVPFIWFLASGLAFKDTAGSSVVDITSLFVTNTLAANLKIECLVDATV